MTIRQTNEQREGTMGLNQTIMNMNTIKTAFLILALCLPPALAAASDDEQLGALMKKREFGQVDRLARERLRANAADEQAYNFVAMAALSGDPTMREDALPLIRTCTEKLPRSGRCHHRLGQLYGAAAMSGGMMAAMKYGSQIKELFQKAVVLDPTNFESRRDLTQFYLQAPSIIGGSVNKAEEQVAAHAKVSPAQAQLLDLDVRIYRKEWDAAEKLLAGFQATDDVSRSALRSATTNLGFALINANLAARAGKLFETAISRQPDVAQFHFGLGRYLLDSKQVDAAIVALERATQLDATLGAQYRLGIAYQIKGDKARAIANLEAFLGTQPLRTGKAADDARQRLDALKRPG